jgi:hypothetical protein
MNSVVAFMAIVPARRTRSSQSDLQGQPTEVAFAFLVLLATASTDAYLFVGRE